MDENKNKSNSTLKKDEKIREHDMTFIEYIKMKSKDKLTIDGEVGIKTRELAQRVGINYEMFRKILNQTKPNQPSIILFKLYKVIENERMILNFWTRV